VLTDERKLELAQQMGLAEVPKPRYETIPKENDPINMGRWLNFKKMVEICTDTILTNSFWPFIPDCVVIDHSMDPRTYTGDNCFAAMIRTDIPVPVSEQITRATGITGTMEFRNFLVWMGLILKEHWTALKPRAMAPPLLCRGAGGREYRKIPGARPFLGMAMKFDLRPPDAQTAADIRPEYGMLLPMTIEDKLKPDHVVLPERTDPPKDAA
jgi:hypothetical protein